MRVNLTTSDGKPAGGIEISDEVLKAREQVAKWMYQHGVRELGELCCLKVSPRAGYEVRLPQV